MSPDEEELRAAAASPAPRGGKRKRKGQQEDTATAPGGASPAPLQRQPPAFLLDFSQAAVCSCWGAGAEDAEAQSGDQGNEDEGSALVVKFKSEHRKMRKNWDLPERFPDARVIKAYREVGLVLHFIMAGAANSFHIDPLCPLHASRLPEQR